MLEPMITKDYCTYSIKILRQEKILRDHGVDWIARCDPASRVRADAPRAPLTDRKCARATPPRETYG
jgi:hypothetical protein